MRGLKNLKPKKSLLALMLCLSFFVGCCLPQVAYADEILASGTVTLYDRQVINGFKLVETKDVPEIGSKALTFEHIKSGAHLLYLQNNDPNKVFSISFYTPPSDNTGVNHILEHSVLYGSEKYPVKSPLMQVMKQSVANFANAMTSNDRTEFPFATTNYKDFKNLLSIYMDAVFNPRFKTDRRVFDQEAWHYELNSKDDKLAYNGVVYNEMQGNYSSPEQLLQNYTNQSLFPDTLYNYEAGGDPAVMPQLTYEKALETYNKNYHPSNSCVYLYGDLDINETLKFLDEQYFSKYDKKTYNSQVPKEKPFTQRQEKVGEYAIPAGADTKNKTYLALNFVTDTNKNTEDLLGLQILSSMLLGMDTSPLKSALLENGFGTSVSGSVDVAVAEPVFKIVVNGANEADKDNFSKFVDDALKTIADGGLDKQTIKSIFNATDFSMRTNKINGQRGLNYSQSAFIGWLYNDNPLQYLEIEQYLTNIKNKIDNGYFESLIKKYLLNNNNSSLVVLKPKAGLSDEKAAETQKALAAYKAKLSSSEVDALVKETKTFKAWQDTPDTPEALATIPTVALSDINTDVTGTSLVEKIVNDAKVLYHPLYTNKLVSMNMYFDTTSVPQDKLPYIYLLCSLLGRLDTSRYDQGALLNNIMDIGNISCSPDIVSKYNDNKVYYPKVTLSCVTMTDKFSPAIRLLSEIMNNTKYDNKDVIKSIVTEQKSNLVSMINNNAVGIAVGRLQSYLSQRGKYNDIGNTEYYRFICDLNDNFDEKYEDVVKNLVQVSKLVFNRENLIVGVTVDQNEYKDVEAGLSTLLGTLPKEKLQRYTYKFDNTTKNEGFATPSNVQYVAKGFNIYDLGYQMNGSMDVLSKILTTEYLTNEVREKGGAYGSSFYVNQDGNAIFYSYRDPNLKETLNIFDKAGDFLRNFKADDKQMTNYILALVNSQGSASDPFTIASSADMSYLSGVTMEDSVKLRNEIMNTKAKDIVAYAGLMDAIAKQNVYCVIGNAAKLNENKGLFSDVVDLLADGKPSNGKALTVAQVKTLIQTAKKSLLCQDYNKAYVETLKLPKEAQPELLAELTSFSKGVFTEDVMKGIDALISLPKNNTLYKFFEIQTLLQKEIKNVENSKYLLNELYTWGAKLVLTDDVQAAMDSLNNIAAQRTSESVKAAEAAIEKVSSKENRAWLTEQLNSLKPYVK